MDRRTFVASLSGAGTAMALPRWNSQLGAQLVEAEAIVAGPQTLAVGQDEAYWGAIQRAFDVDRTYVNLNNGGCSPAPAHVMEQLIRDLRFSNEAPVEHMWGVLEPRKESVRRELAREFGCDAEELAITRNASEANEIVIFGLDLERGDEVVITTQNYGRMQNAWRQREARDGIVLRRVRLETPPRSAEYYLEQLVSAVTPRTRAIEVMQVSHNTGYVAPVAAIEKWARPRGIQVLVDGAHAFAHLTFKRDDLGVDYYGTSLHKWLMAPVGTGFLYVRRERIEALWPLLAAAETRKKDIRKFEDVGTHPAANHNAIAVALAFHRAIGAGRKLARLRYLRARWARPMLDAFGGRARMITPLDDAGGGIGVMAIEGADLAKLGAWLLEQHRIITTPIVHAEFLGLRVTPSVYSTIDEIDRFAELAIDWLRRAP